MRRYGCLISSSVQFFAKPLSLPRCFSISSASSVPAPAISEEGLCKSELDCSSEGVVFLLPDFGAEGQNVPEEPPSRQLNKPQDYGSGEPDASLYNKLLRSCTESRRIKDGKLVHGHFLKSRFNDSIVTHNTIINMYAKWGDMKGAHKVFDQMPGKDMVSWTILITGHSQNAESEEGFLLFRCMLRAGMVPNQFTLGSVLKAAAAAGSEIMGRQAHVLCFKLAFENNVYAASALIDAYARSSQMDEAEVLFKGMESKNEVPWNALIAGYVRKGEGEHALTLFADMKKSGFHPSHFTFSSLFSACASLGTLEQGKWIHGHMLKSGSKLIAYSGNTLLSMYAKGGSIEDAEKVFDRLLEKDVVSWNSIITACAEHGVGKRATEYFEEMLKTLVKPNGVTFLCVLTACSHAGLLDKGLQYFELMDKFQVVREVSHYTTIVDLLGRAGQLDRAHKFIECMPIEPNAAVWKALLGACRMYKNLDLGAYAAERVFELDPYDSGPHILLCNIYASAGDWKNAAKVKKMMKESGVKKEPACSWVEIENAPYLFLSNDNSHPQIDEIHRKWKEIVESIEKIGYVPDTSDVLWSISQQDKERRLHNHSERLAFAFALLKSPPGSTIRIKKNIRICNDCHRAFKFVSKVVDREIILRDTSRFHHFRSGSCSCGDYW